MTALRAKREADGRKVRKLTREQVIEELREYHARYGEVPTSAAFNPATARWRGQLDLVGRYRAGRADGSDWSSLNAKRKLFDGSYDAAVLAAGLTPHQAGPKHGRASGPVRDVRTERVIVPSRATRELERQLEKSQRRVTRLAEDLDAAKAEIKNRPVKHQVHKIRVTDTVALDRLRERLADESSRRRQAERALRNAQNAAAHLDKNADSVPAAGRPADFSPLSAPSPRALAEVDRLTERLSKVERRNQTLENRLERAAARADLARHDAERAERARQELAERVAAMREDAMAEAIVNERVRAAERHVEQADRRVRDLAEVVIGERRALTSAEMRELRSGGGEAGERVMARALGSLTRARKSHPGDVANALTDVARAALTWRDRL